jgi:predicted DNA-binding helix-hairpin-helix protein
MSILKTLIWSNMNLSNGWMFVVFIFQVAWYQRSWDFEEEELAKAKTLSIELQMLPKREWLRLHWKLQDEIERREEEQCPF